ncbi:hypothetical protein SQ11_15905, partial [Nitrosospira sp. NpAV]
GASRRRQTRGHGDGRAEGGAAERGKGAQRARAGAERGRRTGKTAAAAKAGAGRRARLEDMDCHVPLRGDFHFNGHKRVTE